MIYLNVVRSGKKKVLCKIQNRQKIKENTERVVLQMNK